LPRLYPTALDLPRRITILIQATLDFGSVTRDAEQEYRSLRKSSLMLSDALESFIQIFSPPFRRVMWKSLRLTAIVLFLLGLGVDRLASSMLLAAPTWLSWILSVVVALGLIASLTFLAAPTASLVAGFYLDNIADVVEREIDPLYLGLRFAALSLLVNLAVLALTLTLFTGGVRRLLRPEWLSARAGIFRTGGHAPSAASTSR
jgi:etoposide-induced protein 2.4 (EI24)